MKPDYIKHQRPVHFQLLIVYEIKLSNYILIIKFDCCPSMWLLGQLLDTPQPTSVHHMGIFKARFLVF